MKNLITLCLLTVALLGCKKENIDPIGYTALINVPDGTEFTFYEPNKGVKEYKIPEHTFKTSRSLDFSYKPGTLVQFSASVMGSEDADIEVIIIKMASKEVIFSEKKSNIVSSSFTAK